jgi:hypothetical protein
VKAATTQVHKGIAADMTAVAAASFERPAPLAVVDLNITQLALTVFDSQSPHIQLSRTAIAHVLRIALETKIANLASHGRVARIELDDGRYLVCRVRSFPGVAP